MIRVSIIGATSYTGGELLRYLLRHPEASITTLTSETFAGPMAYNALKAALLTYAKQLSQQFMPKNIRVNCLSPGPTVYPGSAWEMVAIADKKFHAATIRQQPARRMAVPEEIARPGLFLLSPAASWVTGAHLLADGGFSKRVQF